MCAVVDLFLSFLFFFLQTETAYPNNRPIVKFFSRGGELKISDNDLGKRMPIYI